MKFLKTYVALLLLAFSSSSIADNSYYYKIDRGLTSGSVVIKDGDTELPPEIGCEGNELTRSELMTLIANNSDVTKACVGTITDFTSVIGGSGNLTFNQDISNWDVSNGKTFYRMFYRASEFNQDISKWNVSNGKNFGQMFWNASVFNQDISNWDVSKGTDLAMMFANAYEFNQNIGSWDVSNVTTFNQMFSGSSSFNQDISKWNVSNGISFYQMFFEANAFSQNVSNWDVSKAISWERFCSNCIAPSKFN